MTSSDQIADEILARSVRLQRVASGVIEEVQDSIPEIRKRVIGEIASSPFGISEAIVASFFRTLSIRLRSVFDQVLAAQIEFARTAVGRATGRPGLFFPGSISLPNVMGASMGEWLERIENDLVFRIGAAVKTQFATDADAAIPRDFLLTEFTAAMVALEALIRTFLGAIANSAMRAVVSKSFDGHKWQQVSVLDSRTSKICREYDSKVWDQNFQPVGHRLPFNDGVPRHWGCRSVIVPVFSGSDVKLAGWLDRPEAEQIFGASLLRLYRRGSLSLGDLVRQASRPLPIKKL